MKASGRRLLDWVPEGARLPADAILDRLIHSSHKLELKGDSMRKRKSASAK